MRKHAQIFAALAALVGCADAPPSATPQSGLPPQRAVNAGRFVSQSQCQTCHTGTASVLSDRAGRDVSPGHLWRGSMMAMAARDPYWLARFEREREAHPSAHGTIDAVCTRCHLPGGSEAAAAMQRPLTFEAVTQSREAHVELGREGVTCSVCHQLSPEGQRSPERFTGGFVLSPEPTLYGPHADPTELHGMAMMPYRTEVSPHLGQSAACASCHTVITRALDPRGAPEGPEFVEQATYLEWQNSDFNNEDGEGPGRQRCVACHMPSRDAEGRAIETVLSNRPRTLGPRPIAQHTFAGANAFMLDLLGAEHAWSGAVASPDELHAGAGASRALLASAARVSLANLRHDGAALHFEVNIENLTGHRLPSGYPSRRAWLEVSVRDAEGALRFVSGAVDADGRWVSRTGQSLESEAPRPHLDRLTREDEIVVYESVMGDAQGRPTHALFAATQYLKDNRLLPRGWRADHPNAARCAPVGVSDDSFVAGRDRVSVAVQTPGWRPARVTVRMLFQATAPLALDAARGGPVGEALAAMVRRAPPRPDTLAQAEATLSQ
ncbi:MAG: hypothetical protein JNK72_23805 [Myxococcales bacterium]|nr:hypothetical protein [Myxococcales bacterium]